MNYSIEEVKALLSIIQVYLIAGNTLAEEHFYISLHL